MEEFMRKYEKVYPKLYRTALYYMRNRQEAEDAVQDAVLAAYEKFYQLRDKEKFDQWMMQILDIEELSLAREEDFATASAVKQVFMELKEEDRLVVSLSVFGGYTSEEIARILGKNHSTVRSRYRRALQKMRKKLEV